MIAKAGFILLVLVFGTLMFCAGVLMPSGVGQTMASAAQRLVAHLPWNEKAGARMIAALPGKSAKAGSASANPPASLAAASLLIPTPLPDTGQYALQAGQFASDADAAAAYDQIHAARLPAQTIQHVQDQTGARWTVVAVGPYASLDAARTANEVVPAQLGLIGPLPLILLPAPPKS